MAEFESVDASCGLGFCRLGGVVVVAAVEEFDEAFECGGVVDGFGEGHGGVVDCGAVIERKEGGEVLRVLG